MSSAFHMNIDTNGIARIVFDLPGEKINKLNVSLLEELEVMLDEAAGNKNIKALVFISGKEEIFIAGADLHTFEPAFEEPALIDNIIKTGHRVFNKLQNLPFPTIAVIQGACLGGGMELALACTYRVVSDHPKTLLGLPEVTLGIFPGWGGSQRLPRLVGLVQGVTMIVTGKPVKAEKAYKIHLADAIVPAEFLEPHLAEFVKSILSAKGKAHVLKRRKLGGLKNFLMEKNPVGRYFLFRKVKKDILNKTKGHYPAPIIALDLIQDTYSLPLQQGLQKEILAFTNNIPQGFASAKHLIALFFSSEALKKDPGVADGTKPLKVGSTGILGAGTMGSGIAWVLSNNGYPVRMKDINWEAVGKGYGFAQSLYTKSVRDKRIKPAEASLRFHRISGTVDYSGFQNADLVIEAAVENLDLKQKIFKELEEVISPNAIVGSNTSSLTIAEMSKSLKYPERFLGMHFFNPANRMPLVEIVAGEKTSSQTIATAVDLCKKMGKTPLVVGDCAGFLVNRIFVPGANEIMRMLEEGVPMDRLEKIMLDFGMPMSPFVLSDEVGNDVGYKVAKSLEQAYGERLKVPAIVQTMYDKHLYGKKSGKGFYIYKGESRKVNPEVSVLLKSIKQEKKSELSDRDIIDRAILAMVNEASRCLQEKIVANPGHLDMAMILGIGFPPFRGGLLRYADDLSIAYVLERLKTFEGLYGPRFSPSDLLVEMGAASKKFY